MSQANISLEPLDSPKVVNAPDGRLIATDTHRTSPITLIISGNHRETVQLFVIPSPLTPFVLGLPWLKTHNPHIYWRTTSISSWRVLCHSHCLLSASTSSCSQASPPPPPPPPDLTSVPLEYHDVATVFSKELALSL